MVGRYNIGEFSRITRLSVKTLRFYDEVGLLKPAEVSLSGYRFYEAAQLPTVRLIRRLKALEFTLEEIRDFLQGRTTLEEMLERQGHLLEERAALQPDFVDDGLLEAAIAETRRKKGLPAVDRLRVEQFAEGRCAQILHVGPFSEEGPTIERLHEFINARSRPTGKHHEIYLTDIRRADPARWKTIIRQPMA